MQQKVSKKIKLFYLLLIILIMCLFNNNVKADYEKSFYEISIVSIDGNNIDLNEYSGNVILLVNVASYCGFTKQYNDLQKIWDQYKDKGLIVLGIPSNSFNQEKKNENEVKKFCEVNFNINFPMTSIFDVKGDNAHEIYKWAKSSYGKSTIPKWNFHKILINKEGKIVDTFLPFTKPNSKKIIKKIEKLLY